MHRMRNVRDRERQIIGESINKIRKVYHGKLVYNTNHGSEDKVEWFDALDYIGTSAYYRVGTP